MMKITKEQRRAAIAATGKTRMHIAQLAGVSAPTLSKWVDDAGVTSKNHDSIVDAISRLGWEFTETGVKARDVPIIAGHGIIARGDIPLGGSINKQTEEE